MEHGLGMSRAWAWYLALVVFVGQYYVVSAYGATANDTLYVVIGASAVFAAIAGLAIHRPPRFVAWLLIALSIGAYLAADAVLSQLEADNVIVPFPSLADWLYLGIYPVLIVAFAIVRRGIAPGPDRGATIDSLMVGVAGFGVLAPLYAVEVWNSPFWFERTEQWVAIAYPIGDALLLAAGARLIYAAGRRVNALTLLGAAAIAIVIGNAAYNVAALGDGFVDGGLGSLGWLGFTSLLGGALLHPSVRFSGTSADAARRPWPNLMLVAAPVAVVGAHFAWGDADSRPTSIACLAVVLVLSASRFAESRSKPSGPAIDESSERRDEVSVDAVTSSVF